MIFRYLDLLVSIAIALALLLCTAAFRQQAREMAVVSECASNLRQIAQSLVLYQGVFDGEFPRTRYIPGAPAAAYTGADAADPFQENGPAANDVTAAGFLLARAMDVGPETFICPAALRHGLAEPAKYDRATVKRQSNFRARLNYNYSLANMYPGEAAIAAGYSLNRFISQLPPTFVIAGDTNPGGAALSPPTTQAAGQNQMRMHNSPNHQRDGQNLLFADGSVRFYGSPLSASADDHVFASQGTFPEPASAADVVLLPTWDMGPNVTSTTVLLRRWSLIAAVIVATALIGVVIWRGTHPRRSPDVVG